MRRRVRRSAQARADIRGISQWIVQNSGSVNAALKWIRDLDERVERIADAPGTGTTHDDLEPGLRSSPFGNYMIFFRSGPRTLTVMRAVHGGRDMSHGLPD